MRFLVLGFACMFFSSFYGMENAASVELSIELDENNKIISEGVSGRLLEEGERFTLVSPKEFRSPKSCTVTEFQYEIYARLIHQKSFFYLRMEKGIGKYGPVEKSSGIYFSKKEKRLTNTGWFVFSASLLSIGAGIAWCLRGQYK